MSYTWEKVSGNQVKIAFEIESDKFDAALQQAYLKNRGRMNVPGFRRGHAPRKLIETMYGEGVFYDAAFDIVFPDAYEEAVKTENLQVVDRPEIDEMKQIGAGKTLEFTVKVFVSPEVTLGNYKGLKAVKKIAKITDEQVDARIAQDVEKVTTMQDVEGRAVENGDTVALDYAGTVDGVAFEGGTAQDQTLEIGSGRFIPGFEEQMIGMNIGEEKDLHVTFPKEYHAADLAGKEAVFHVALKGVQTRVKPALDDDFAADVSEYSTFDEYKASIVRDLTDRAEKNADTEMENDLVQQAVDAADCDIPDAMIEDEIDVMLRQMKLRMAYQGLKFEDYLKYTGQTEEQMRDMYRSDAANRVKTRLVIDAVRKAEGIEATDEEYENEIREEAEREGREAEDFKASLTDQQKEYLKENAAIRKTVDLLKDAAEVTVREVEPEEKLDLNETVSAVENAVEAASENEQE